MILDTPIAEQAKEFVSHAADAKPAQISPTAHRRFDLLVFPMLAAGAMALLRRDRRATAIGAFAVAGEGAATLMTNYPPATGASMMNFRQHNIMGAAQGGMVALLALTVPGISPRNRQILCALASVPILMALLSDTRTDRFSEEIHLGRS